MMTLFLASRSPRRRELLTQIGVDYALLDIAVDESPACAEPAVDYVQRVAAEKARAGYACLKSGERAAVVLAADTTVYVDDSPMGKPADKSEAAAMLAQLSGRWHRVATAVALAVPEADDARLLTALSISEVQFKPLSPQEIEAYCATEEPYDKAGGYAVQGLAALFIATIRGSYTGIMGLPLYETGQLLREAGIVTALDGACC